MAEYMFVIDYAIAYDWYSPLQHESVERIAKFLTIPNTYKERELRALRPRREIKRLP